MQAKRKSFIIIIAFICFIFAGCGILPSPSSLISSPKYAHVEQDPQYIAEALVRQHLPEGTTLYIPDNPATAEAIYQVDINLDGNDEIVATYKYMDKNQGVGCIIFEEQEDGWKVLFDELFHIDKLHWVSLDNVAGDNSLELLIGFGLGDYYSLRIYSFGVTTEIIYKGDYSFLKLMESAVQEPKPIFMLTQKDTTYANQQKISGYYGKIIRWEDDDFALAEDLYADNYTVLEPFYRKEYEKSKSSVISNYYFAEWMVNCNHPEEALELIETIKQDETFQYKKYVIKTGILEGQALSELGRYDEAGEIMESLITGIEEGHYSFMSYKLPYLYLLLGRNYIGSGQTVKAREAFEKSVQTNEEYLLRRYEENRFWLRMAQNELEKMN